MGEDHFATVCEPEHLTAIHCTNTTPFLSNRSGCYFSLSVQVWLLKTVLEENEASNIGLALFPGNGQQKFFSEDDCVSESWLISCRYALLDHQWQFWKLKFFSKHFTKKPKHTLYTSQMKSIFTFSLTPGSISKQWDFTPASFSMTNSNSHACFAKLKPG